MRSTIRSGALLIAVGAAAGLARAGDWPQWGHDAGRNMVSDERGLPVMAAPAKPADAPVNPTGASLDIDLSAAKNVKWAAKLGTHAYGNPTVAGGRLYVGTNNESPRDPKIVGDYNIGLCFDAATGKFQWQLAVPKMPAGKNLDPEGNGLTSSPAVDGDRVYLVTNAGEVLCLDAHGLADGNAGPFTDEAQYAAGPGKPAIELGPANADIVWRYDLRRELGVVAHQAFSSSPLVVGDRLYLNTCNAVDWTERHVPAPAAPVLVCLDKKSGKLLGQERAGIAGRSFTGNWSAPSFGVVAGKPTVVLGAADGFCYGFDPDPDAAGTLAERWRVDCNLPEYRVGKDGQPIKYQSSSPRGPNAVVATPVVHGGRVYVGIGRDPDNNTDNPGCFSCIGDKAGKVDVVWRNPKIIRTMSTASISADGLIYLAVGRGIVHCLDAGTGEIVWSHDTESTIWGSTLLADGRVYVGCESGEINVLAAGREEKLLGTINLADPIHSTPVAAGGVLYVATDQFLYALADKGEKTEAKP